MRPSGLPSFASPPLHEVVMGVQFASIDGYKQIYAGDVWKLFQEKFPVVEERQAIPPSFETFGGGRQTSLSLQIASGPMHDRYWFVSSAGDSLLQFQADRFLHNWRKRYDIDNVYPRYEQIADEFKKETELLNSFFEENFSGAIEINQCELSYVNHIQYENKKLDIEKWINFIDSSRFECNDISVRINQDVIDDINETAHRLYCEISSAIDSRGEPVLVFSLSVKGAPKDATLAAAYAFHELARVRIVNTFTKLTTPYAHERWGRIE